MKRLLSVILCLSLLLGSIAALAEGKIGSIAPSNVSDNRGPSIVKYVFDEDGKTLKPGDTLHVKVKLDDQSDITGCDASFRGAKNKDASIGLILEYDAASDMYKGEYELAATDLDDTYALDVIYAEDKFGNSTQVYKEKANLGSFTLKGATGSLKIKGTATIQENRKTLKPEEKAHITVNLKEKFPKAAFIEANFQLADDTKARFAFYLDRKTSKSYEGTASFMETDRNGKYVLTDISLYDENYTPLGILEVTGQYIYLKGASNDTSAPTISSVTLQEKGKALKPGDKLHISARVTDRSSELNVYGMVAPVDSPAYVDENGVTTARNGDIKIVEMKYNKSSGKYEGTWNLPKNLPDGEYNIGVSASDKANNGVSKFFKKLSFTYSSPDFADQGIKAFITECFKAATGKKPTKAEINEYGVPLASGKKKAVNIIKAVMKKAKLSGDAAAEALWQVMQGKKPSDAEKARTAAALKEGLENGIDSLNNAAFRQRCKEWGIKPGNFGTKKSNTKVSSVDVAGGHYILNGSKATLSGVTDKSIKKLNVKDTVEANGKTYKVTKIDSAACLGLKNLSTLTIGKNVTSIGQDAFKDCKKLKTVTINATKLKTVGKDAFRGIQKKAVFKCPEKQKAAYKKLIKKNAPKNAKFE